MLAREQGVNMVTEEDVTPDDDQELQVGVDAVEAITLSLKRENSERVRSRKWSKSSVRVSLNKAKRDKSLVSEKEGQADMVKGQRLIEKETMETGKNMATIGQNLWLSDWTNDASLYINTTYPASERDQRLGIFGVLGVAQ
eukprot:g38976.t1